MVLSSIYYIKASMYAYLHTKKKKLAKKTDAYLNHSTNTTNGDRCRNFKNCKDTEGVDDYKSMKHACVRRHTNKMDARALFDI
jgi:hypothetical protein